MTTEIRNRVLAVAILVCVIVLCVWTFESISQNRRDSQLTQMPPGTEAVVVPPTGQTQTDLEALLPEGSSIVKTLQADLDDDGQNESLAAFNLSHEAGGLLVVHSQTDREPQVWTVEPRPEGQVVDLVLVDVNADRDSEVLLHEALEDKKQHYLHILDWDGTSLVRLNPHDGPLDGMEGFQSDCLPSEFKDVNMDGALELLVYQDQPSYGRLTVLVYIWTNGVFAYDDANYVVGPSRPAHCAEVPQ